MLNAEQSEVVTHDEGPALVIAGAGSGKTTAMVHRIKNLLDRGISDSTILAVTFSSAAAKSLNRKLYALVGNSEVHVSTFHSLGRQIISDFTYLTNYSTGFGIIEPWTEKKIIKTAIEESLEDMEWDRARTIIHELKRNLVHVDDCEQTLELADYGFEPSTMELICHVYKELEKYKESNNIIDFDDMILIPNMLFDKHSEVLQEYKDIFKYGVVDEAQDTNAGQFRLADMIIDRSRLMIIGDDFQSIYGFQGARPDISIHGFKQKNAKVYTFNSNYRSTNAVVDNANRLVRSLENPFKKSMVCMSEEEGSVVARAFLDQDQEATQVIQDIKEILAREKCNHKDIAILFRLSAQARAIEESLVAADIPYVLHGIDSFFSRKEVREVISYLQLAVDPEKYHRAVLNVLNIASASYSKRFRGLGKTFIADLKAADPNMWRALKKLSLSGRTSSFQKAAIKDLIRLVEKISKPDDIQAKMSVLINECYMKHLIEEYGLNSPDPTDSRLAIIGEIRALIGRFNNNAKHLFGYFAKMQIFEKRQSDPDFDGVQIMTIHRSKGLEWDHVFVIGMSDGILPHAKSGEMEDGIYYPGNGTEEERRLCYVAVTRAAKSLAMYSILSSAESSSKLYPSMFLKEMDIDIDKLASDARMMEDAMSLLAEKTTEELKGLVSVALDVEEASETSKSVQETLDEWGTVDFSAFSGRRKDF